MHPKVRASSARSVSRTAEWRQREELRLRDDRLRDVLRLEDDRLRGTFFPFARASESAIAIACLRDFAFG